MRKGSITVFLSLLMTVMLCMLSAGIRSVKIQAARTQILCGVDIGLFSVFGQYDRKLLEEYDLFAIHAEGESSPNLGAVYQSFEKYMCNVFRQNTDSIAYKNGGFTGCRLLTDNDGDELYTQIVKAEEVRCMENAADSAENLVPYLQEMKEAGIEWEALLGRLQEESEVSYAFDLDSPVLEILGITVNSGAVFTQLPSQRLLYQGIPVFDNGEETCQHSAVLLKRYTARHFGCMAARQGGEALSLEYIAYGENSDQKNLEKTAEDLLYIIEGILSSKSSCEEDDIAGYMQIYADSVEQTRNLILTGEGAEFSYEAYLNARISELEDSTVLHRVMDMIEFNLSQFEQTEVHLDHMIIAAEVSVDAEAEGSRTFHTVRKYGYD